MYTGTLHAASNRADYGFHVALTNPNTGAVIDLTGATISFVVRQPRQSLATITATSPDPAHIVITNPTGGEFDVKISKAELNPFLPGTSDFGLNVILSDGVTYPVMAAELPVVDGVFNP